MKIVEIVAETYAIICHRCGNPFDALKAVWCTCLTDECTLVCSSCSRCFCTASKPYKDKFWEQAPQSIWDEKINNERIIEAPQVPWDGKLKNEKTISYNPNTPETVIRPLVLVVDDTPASLSSATRAIGSLGYGTILARNGVVGLALAKEYKPDLILSAFLLPKLDGLQFCQLIKLDPETRKAKFILMTSSFGRGTQKTEMSNTAAADDYVKKPLNVNQLSELLKKHLNEKTGFRGQILDSHDKLQLNRNGLSL